MVISKCVSCLLIFKISLPINTIILFIQTDSRTLTNTIGNIYLMNQSQLIITSHIQSYRNRGIASSLMTFPHSFSITPPNSRHTLEGLLKLNGLRGGERDADSRWNFTCWCRCWTLSKVLIYTLFNVIFSKICVILFLYYKYFSHPIFWGGSGSLSSSEEMPLLCL